MTKINFTFGERKVQKVRYTFLIPLPAAWAKNANLDQSSSVIIEMLDDYSLKITPNSTSPARSEKTGCATLN